MKKGIKIVLVILLLLVCAAGGGWYFLMHGSDAGEMGERINEEIGNATDQIIGEIDSEISAGQDEQPVDDPGVVSGSEGSTGKSPSKQPVEEKITIAYDSAFLKLQSEGNRVVNSLLDGIKQDYDAMKDAGKTGAVDLAKLASSYVKRADVLEKSMDSSVKAVLQKMEADMKAAGIDETTIKAYIADYQAEYEKQKKIRRDQITAKAASYL